MYLRTTFMIKFLSGGHSKVMSVGEANRHRNVLTMAVFSEHSCDPVMKVIGKEVTKLFPSPVLLEETVRVLAGIKFYL